jgi:Raf kinase inhibitor-like YbhB/YbcL family protein
MRFLLLPLMLSLSPLSAMVPPKFNIIAPAFAPGAAIPKRFTCDGENISPALAWTGVPDSVKSLALICDDPDAPSKTWVHWVVYNVPVTLKGFEEGLPKTEKLENGAFQGISDFGDFGYGGPCPPSGKHRYFFKLYALSETLPLVGKVTKEQLEMAMKDKTLGTATLMGTYKRIK